MTNEEYKKELDRLIDSNNRADAEEKEWYENHGKPGDKIYCESCLQEHDRKLKEDLEKPCPHRTMADIFGNRDISLQKAFECWECREQVWKERGIE